MELNIITLLLVSALMIYMSFTRIKLYNDNQKEFEKLSKKRKFAVLRTGKWVLVAYVVIAVLTGFLTVRSIMSDAADALSWTTVYGVLFITSTTDILRTLVTNTTYYNEEGFYNNCKFIRYKSIRNFKPRRLPIATEVNLFNGDTHSMPTKALQTLEPYILKAK